MQFKKGGLIKMPIVVGRDVLNQKLCISDDIMILAVGPFLKEYEFCIFHHGRIIGFGGAGNIKIKIYNLEIEIEIACEYVIRIDFTQEKDKIFY